MRLRPRAIIALTLIGIAAVIVSLVLFVRGLLNQSEAKLPEQKISIVHPADNESQAVPTRAEIKADVDRWLAEHPDRKGKMREDNILPGKPYRATAVRFPDNSPVKNLSKENQWSQILIHADDHDEKWLLKDGHTYKWEVLDKNKKTIETGYF